MSQTKQIDRESWLEYLSMFSNGNRGRMIAIEIVGEKIGAQTLASGTPLFAIDYDPAGKGDNLLISTGLEGLDLTHEIDAPVELRELQDDNGMVVSMEIVDRAGTRTILDFKS